MRSTTDAWTKWAASPPFFCHFSRARPQYAAIECAISRRDTLRRSPAGRACAKHTPRIQLAGRGLLSTAYVGCGEISAVVEDDSQRSDESARFCVYLEVRGLLIFSLKERSQTGQDGVIIPCARLDNLPCRRSSLTFFSILSLSSVPCDPSSPPSG